VETKKVLGDSPYAHRQDLQFMLYVKSAMAKLSTDKSHFVDETKGRWVSQSKFLEVKNLERRTLTTYRSNGKKSDDGLSGTDTQGHHWRKKGTIQNEQPEYFLENNE
jgi:hypothetical protein